jgi:hypothetical protein
MFKRALALTVASAAALTACHSPGGGWYPYSGGSNTYYSFETAPKTVVLIDTRSGEEFFTMDIPVGKQLTFDFVAGEGDDPVLRPDLMRWEVWDQNTYTGQLTNTLSVPHASSRRIDVFIRDSIEYKTGSPDTELGMEHLEQSDSKAGLHAGASASGLY